MKISFEGLDQLTGFARDLEQFTRQELNLSGLERPIADLIAEQNRESFDQQRGPDGQQWPPLRPGTVRQKARYGFSNKPLIRTGAMYSSATHPIVTISDGRKQINATYSGPHAGLIQLHNLGGGGLPARHLGGFGERLRDQITALAFRRLETGFAARLGKRRK